MIYQVVFQLFPLHRMTECVFLPFIGLKLAGEVESQGYKITSMQFSKRRLRRDSKSDGHTFKRTER